MFDLLWRIRSTCCAPCESCGWDVPAEIEHLNDKIHPHTTYEIHEGLKLTLCNFCTVDFRSYPPEYFGFKNGKRLDLGNFNFVKQIKAPEVLKDKFCPARAARLTFLTWVAEIRELNKKRSERK